MGIPNDAVSETMNSNDAVSETMNNNDAVSETINRSITGIGQYNTG